LVAAAVIAGQSGLGQSGNDLEPVDLDPVLVTASPFVERKAELVVPASELPGDALRRSTEYSNLADTHPEKLLELQALWWKEAEKNNALPMLEAQGGRVNSYNQILIENGLK